VGIKGKGLNVSDINYGCARRRRRVILFNARRGIELGGDPTMTVWTAEPEAIGMEYDSSEAGLTYMLEVEVKDEVGEPVAGAVVVLWVEDVYYLVEKTNETGKVRFKELEPCSGGKLTSWDDNYVPALHDNVSVGGD
jgi:hypothetical protein